MPSKPRFNAKAPLSAVALAALTACTGVTVSLVDHANQYDPQQASAAGGGDRQMQVVVIGNPFDMPQSALEKAVIDAMQSSAFGVPINFAINPENPDPSRPYRVVFAFNPEGIRDPGKLCESTDGLKTAAVADGKVTLMGAFCSTDSYLSHGIARASDVAGTGSETFGHMIFQLTTSLFPGRNPNDQSAGDTPIPAP
ncbi:MAG: hypothetical protein HOL07_12910 [Rhodospirillaceae bacterium]|jgi:hypothetical protein|nr:hypothetical protein [Rhodospirillaceae bacterium]MBT5359237.1 hypothetical protein [Rhodospirillaceae bacterium]MBT5769106.1 hypothetical protein [Rhodospirillaceae bacterium]MBT6310542.1 hypothetical protein [Rhodospirillaceae bacterium]MBT7365117.1 hypothetical protein [Rhodospirillaceae bacterium]